MKTEHHALLEAMEQQRVSVAKAGILSSLSARASVMAAANPSGGHYDRSKTIAENLKMSAALLSRFDLVFILLDKSDTRRDAQLTDHVLASMSGVGAAADTGAGTGARPPRLPASCRRSSVFSSLPEPVVGMAVSTCTKEGILNADRRVSQKR